MPRTKRICVPPPKRSYAGRPRRALALVHALNERWKQYVKERFSKPGEVGWLRERITLLLDLPADIKLVEMMDAIRALRATTFIQKSLKDQTLSDKACCKGTCTRRECFAGFTMLDMRKSPAKLCLVCMRGVFMTCVKCQAPR